MSLVVLLHCQEMKKTHKFNLGAACFSLDVNLPNKRFSLKVGDPALSSMATSLQLHPSPKLYV